MLDFLIGKTVKVNNYGESGNDLSKVINYKINEKNVIIGIYNNKISNVLVDIGDVKIIFEINEEKYRICLWREKEEFNQKKGALEEEEIFNLNLDVNSWLPFKQEESYFIKLNQTKLK